MATLHALQNLFVRELDFVMHVESQRGVLFPYFFVPLKPLRHCGVTALHNNIAVNA